MNHWNFDEIVDVLRQLPKPIHLALVPGNNGDTLIHMGARELLRQIGENSVPIERAQSVVIVGHGVFTYKEFSHVESLGPVRTILKAQDKALVLLPFSTLPGNAELLAGVLNRRAQPTWVYCRENISKAILEPLLNSGVRLKLGHDAAFALAASEFMCTLSAKSQAVHVLVVERFDNEGTTTRPRIFRIPESLRARIPASWRGFAKKRVLAQIYSATPFAQSIRSALPPGIQDLPMVAGDISQQQNYSFEQFCSLINNAACVHSTRLHAAILAVLLGKPTVLYAGANHKFRGIYEHSLQQVGTAKLA